MFITTLCIKVMSCNFMSIQYYFFFKFTEVSTVDEHENLHLTAEDGSDFIGFEDMVINFPVGDGHEHVLIPLAEGVDVDKQEYFEVCMDNAVSGIVDGPRCAIVYIEDDDCKSFTHTVVTLHLEPTLPKVI